MTTRRRRPLLRTGMVSGTAVVAGTKAEQGRRQQEYGRAAAVAPIEAPAAAPAVPVKRIR